MTLAAVWVIYDHPRDYPGHFVVRRWRPCSLDTSPEGAIPDALCQLADTLEAAREKVPPGFVRIGPQQGEDPSIAETWL